MRWLDYGRLGEKLRFRADLPAPSPVRQARVELLLVRAPEGTAGADRCLSFAPYSAARTFLPETMRRYSVSGMVERFIRASRSKAPNFSSKRQVST